AAIAAAAGLDGRLYVVDSNALLVYTPTTDSWVEMLPVALPNARDQTGVARGSDGFIYSIGGHPGAIASELVDAWQPATSTWTSRAPLHVARAYPSAVAAPDGRIYAIGGGGLDGSTTATVEAYTPERDHWVDVAPLITRREQAGAAL